MEPIDGLIESVFRQFARNANANLLSADVEAAVSISNEFLQSLERSAASRPHEGVTRQSATSAAREFVSLALNPYIEVDRHDGADVEATYRETARRSLSGKPPREVLGEYHYPALQDWVRRKYPMLMKDALGGQTALGRVSYTQYTAERQREVLGLHSARLTAPLLDLGCGADADLVRHFRLCGITAYGVDPWIPESSEYLYSASWFDYPIEDIRAGLIVSHLAFSSHLIYQQTTGGPEPERNLQRYRRIPTALPTGGAFVYAPSAPFVEDELSSLRFTVERWSINRSFGAARVTRIA